MYNLIYNIKKFIYENIDIDIEYDYDSYVIIFFFHKHLINKYTSHIYKSNYTTYIRLDVYYINDDIFNHILKSFKTFIIKLHESNYVNYIGFELNKKKFINNYNDIISSVKFIENLYKIHKWIYKPVLTDDISKQCISARIAFGELSKLTFT